MKKILVSICITLMPFAGYAAEASRESIEVLLELTHMQQVIEEMIPQMETIMKSTIDQSLDLQKHSPEERQKAKAFAEAFTKKMVPILKGQLDWQKMKEIYAPIYRDSFSQEEIDGLIAFYASPAGKAFTAKMPLVMKKSVAAVQQIMGPMLQEIRKAAAETAKEFKR